MTLPAPPDPGEPGTGPPLRIIETEDIEIFSDIKWIQPGRFSDILYGYCHSLAETVALKRLRVPDDGECSARDLRLFNEEASIWHTLDHPHVLPLRGIYVCPEGFTYLVSPYMINGDLMSYLKHNPLVDRRGLLCDIASAIAYLHSLEIIHGDIKARNILVSQDGEIRLCDFGLSKYSSWTTSEGRKGAGTIRWQSPELLFDEPKSFKSDVYAFGITTYEVLSGNLPFGSSSDGAIVYNVVLRNTRPPCLPKFSPTGQSYATTWALAKECWHRVPDSRPDMVTVWKRLEMEVFPDATLRVLVAEKARMTARSARVFKGGTSATGGVGPPARERASAAGRGRTFTADAASDDDEDAEESDNELGHRRHTINVDAISHHTSEPCHHSSSQLDTAEPDSYDYDPEEAAADDDEEEEPEFLFTPNDSPLLGATEGPVCRTSRGGLLPTGGGELEAIDEDFSLDGEEVEEDGEVEDGNRTKNDQDEQVEAQPTAATKRILPGVPAKDPGHTKKQGGNTNSTGGNWTYLGTGRQPFGRWSTTKSIGGDSSSSTGGGGNPTKSSRRRRRDEDEECECDCHCEECEDDIHHHKINGRGHSSPGKMADDDSSSSGYYGSLISAITSAYECTKSMIGYSSPKSILQTKSTNPTDSTQNLQRQQQPTIDWANWDGKSVPMLDGA
ncbi:hypothetical protein M407DRAFT_29992 [Tulasnella calospora MUT 4182]|uniref:Protein kinase domain-containing protein n=1 Tax=Tulasnella calospora MUT 4182 TaxID=1051891 RepID=A0A0C3PYK0_9AGAM|nr:hypothetical protein M407DRAFT_29992 [Tulasnella calospora MUT 4182]